MAGGATIRASHNLSDLVLGRKYVLCLDITDIRLKYLYYDIILPPSIKGSTVI
jgi:hypothetical protein